MMSFASKFKIPTLLGLSVIILGIVAGVFLVLKEQIFLSQASPSLTPQNIILSNTSDLQISISWQTSAPTTGFINFGQESFNEQTALDDRDTNTPKPHLTHYVTLKNLRPQTNYQFKIISGKLISEVNKFETAAPPSSQNGLQPIIGSVLDGDKPLDEGIVYLSIAGIVTQSAQIKSSGNFLIPISLMRKSDLSDVYQPNPDDVAKLTIIGGNGQASALFKLNSSGQSLPPIKLGQNIDLTNSESVPSPTPSADDLKKYDLNGDGLINANDYAIVLQNFGKSPQNEQSSTTYKKADLNRDGVVDQKDVDLMVQRIRQLGGSI